MKVILSAAVSLDGYIDDSSSQRLILSSPEDLEAVRALRESSDAILVGANTIRRDNPSLAAAKMKVALTASANLSPQARFFHDGSGKKLVYSAAAAVEELGEKLGGLAEIIAIDSLHAMLRDLEARGVKTLLVEGGATVLTQFLSEGLAHELRLAVAPFLVGDRNAPRFLNPAAFPHNKDRRMKLTKMEALGGTAVLHYDLGGRQDLKTPEK